MPIPYRFVIAWIILAGGLLFGWMLPDRDGPTHLSNVLLGLVYVTSKIATVLCVPPADQRKWTIWRFALYLLWPGMRPAPFLSPSGDDAGPKPTVVGFLLNLAAGVALVWVVPLLLPAATPLLVRVWVGIVGVSFLYMFALMDAFALVYRAIGIPVEKLWVSPATAVSLREFWGSRWNRVFSGMYRDVVFKPLARPLGVAAAAVAVFVASGLLHENLTVAVRSGYGGPTVYFVIQAVAFLLEGTRAGRAALHGRPILGWCWSAVVVIGPLGLLVPSAFLDQVVIPMLESLRAPGFGPAREG